MASHKVATPLHEPSFSHTALLNEVTAPTKLDNLETYTGELLARVTASLEMDIGIISHIEDDVYEVQHVHAPEVDLSPGTTFALSQTYCEMLLRIDGVLSIDHMKCSEHRHHPCYGTFHLESYIGARILVDDQLFGTVNFTSHLARQRPFTPDDEVLLSTLAHWLGVSLGKQQAEAARRDAERRYRRLAEVAFEALALTENSVVQDVNPAFCELFGYTPSEAIGRGAAAFVVRTEVEQVMSRIARGDERPYEATCLRRDGTTFDAEVRGRMIYEGERTLRVTAIRDISEYKRITAKLHSDAIHDPLTGLKNRAAFIERLRREAERAKRYPDYGFAVLFLDFDRFKTINDSLGHHVGDDLLVAISQRLLSTLRDVDTVARLGGDEFIVLLDGVSDVTDAEAIAQKLLERFRSPFYAGGHTIETSASIGVALSSSSPEHPEYLIRNADAAMYRAKALGKAQYATFGETLQRELTQRLTVEKNLRHAIEQGNLALLYQPIVSLEEDRIVAVEALVRWPQPDGSVMTPDCFIPIAEETGLIVPLGQWVIEEACHQVRAWQQETGNPNLSVHVNLSTKQFVQDDLAMMIASILKDADLSTSALCLEVTESALITNPEQTVKTMRELKEIGIRLYIDDFGTGYSSLSHLHTFPLAALKIDCSFVGNIESTESAKIIEAIYALAQSLNMSVIAEGIETEVQLEVLRNLGCEYGQGYKFAEPLSVDALSAML